MIENIGAYSKVDYDRGYQQGRADSFSKCKLENGEYCWQECCATEQCGECAWLNNGDTCYFDNTFCDNCEDTE